MDLRRLMELCMCPAPQGGEQQAKRLIRGWLPEGLCVREDAAGSLIVCKPGKRPGLMLMAGLSQSTILVTGRKKGGVWKIQPLGAGKDLKTLDGWRVSDAKGAQGIIAVREGELFLEDAVSVEAGTSLTLQPDWRQDERSVTCSGIGDRIGCWMLAELLRTLPLAESEIVCVFLAQEALNSRTAELAAGNADIAAAIRWGSAPARDANITGVPVEAGKGPAVRLRERYASTDGRMLDFIRQLASERRIPYQYELLELSVTGLYTAQYGRCGVVVGGVDVPEEKGKILIEDLEAAGALLSALAGRRDALLTALQSLPAVAHLPSPV